MFLSIILTLLGAGIASVNAKCDNFELVVCAFLVDGEKTSKTGLAETEETLDARCHETLPVLKCLNEFGNKCSEDSSYKHLAQFFQSEYQTQTKICDKKDDLRKRYLNNAKCLNMYRGETGQKCGELLEFGEAEKFTKEHCKTYENTFQCSLKEIQSNCGKDAFLLEMEILKPVHNFMETSCKDFQDLHNFSMLKSLLPA